MSSQYYFENYCLFLFCHSYHTRADRQGQWFKKLSENLGRSNVSEVNPKCKKKTPSVTDRPTWRFKVSLSLRLWTGGHDGRKIPVNVVFSRFDWYVYICRNAWSGVIRRFTLDSCHELKLFDYLLFFITFSIFLVHVHAHCAGVACTRTCKLLFQPVSQWHCTNAE